MAQSEYQYKNEDKNKPKNAQINPGLIYYW